jgi:hypothetical protein
VKLENELPIPPLARTADSAVEIARVWVADGDQHVTLATAIWKDPASWGVVLADLARHVARACAETAGLSSDAALNRIQQALIAELDSPTDEPTGGLMSS